MYLQDLKKKIKFHLATVKRELLFDIPLMPLSCKSIELIMLLILSARHAGNIRSIRICELGGYHTSQLEEGGNIGRLSGAISDSRCKFTSA